MPIPPVDVESEGSTRDRILDAALDLFSAKGYEGASIRQLARSVGLRESSIYNHFTGKGAIYAALVDAWGPADSAKRLRSTEFRALSDRPVEFCRRCSDELLEQWLNPREQRFQELIRLERSRTADARQHYYDTLFRDEVGLYSEYFRQFATRGLIRTTDARETARIFTAGFTFIRLEHFLMPDEPSPRRVVREALDRFLEQFLAMIDPA